jgi:hypothetical protein
MAPASPLEQLGEGALGGAKDAGQPDVDDVGPHLVVELAGEGEPALSRRKRRLAEGVVVQDVEAAEGLHGTAHHVLDARGSARVGGDGHRLASRSGDLRRHRLGLGPVDVGYRDLRAARCEPHGGGAADARSRARYQSHLAVESHVLASWNQAPPLVVRGRWSGRESTTKPVVGFLT